MRDLNPASPYYLRNEVRLSPRPVNTDYAHQANISLEPSFSAVCRKRIDALNRPAYDAVIDTRY
ncbi:hypothetical protein [Undibacterium sp. Xuan67W]|uniref:hypothetical protein n=1 Tax=Undibacterium sp. Xuan67W TaxID=3413057 RepID=UPI003BF5BCA4